MRWFQNLSIGAKLMSSFALAAALAAGIGWIGLSSTERVHQLASQMYADRLMPIRDLGYANAAFLNARVDLRSMLAIKSSVERQKLSTDIAEQSRKFDEYLGSYLKTNLTREEQDLIARFRPSYEEYKQHRANIVQLALNGQDAAALAIAEGAARNSQLESRRLLRELIDVNAKLAEQDEKDSQAASQAARYKILTLIGLGVLVCIALGFAISRIIGNPVRKLSAAADVLASGDVNVELPAEGRDELGALARSFRVMADNIKERSTEAQKLAAGDLTVSITTKSDRDVLGKSLIQAVETLRNLVAEAEQLTKAAVAGQLSTRGHAEQFEGGYRKIVDGVNQTLDAVIGPLNVSAEYVDRISKGDIPSKITDNYSGDFNVIKANLNLCIDSINALVADAAMLSKAAVEGKLATRADATRHHGDYRKIVDGVNQTLDAVIGPLNVSAQYVDRISKGDIPPKITDNYNGDFNVIKTNLNVCIDSINALVGDTVLLAQAAVEGKLSTRADASKHNGDYRRIVEGVNQTLDAILAPINEAASVLERVASQDLTVQVSGNYKGDHAKIKENINRMIVDLRQNILQIAQNAQSLASSAEELSAVSHQMSSSATETSTQAGVVSAASEQVSKNVSVVATGSEQMLASIREIARSSNEAAKVARNAVGIADSTNQTVSKLGDSSIEIGNVIKVITSIAQQTNLLALNATIEAARAGEAGKGFAVVANEVKELANQTARATEEIGQRIEAIQTDTKEAVGAIGGISGIINQINDISNSIAASVEEQTATTNEMGRNVSEAAKGTGEIARNINGVAAAAQQTNQGASNTEAAARSLTEMAAGLQLVVSKFRT